MFTKESVNPEMPPLSTPIYPTMRDLFIDETGVEKLVHQLNTNKASGSDNLPNRVLQQYSKELTPCLTHLFRQSISSGELPEDWRTAKRTPVFKKGSRHLASNYIPVSLTCV